MSEHLYECTPSFHDFDNCICDQLRACEQRVEEAMDRAWTYRLQQIKADCGDHDRIAYDAGVAAAREAVAGLEPSPWPSIPAPEYLRRDDVLAAIDALRGES